MKRALLITNIFPPQIGGPATFIDRVARHMAAAGVKVTVVCSSLKRDDPGDAKRPFRVLRIPLKNRIKYEILLRLTLISQVFRHRNILVNGLETYVYPIARFWRRPYLLKIVGDTVWETARNQGRTYLNIDDFQTSADAQTEWKASVEVRNRYVLGAAKVITPSAYLQRMVIRWGMPAARVVVIKNGVDLEASDHSPAGILTRSTGEPLKVLFVGRLTNWKGVETLLLAVADLPRVEVQVAGDGPEFPALVELRNQLLLQNRVHFSGRLDAKATVSAMKSSHVLVLTSLYEGLSHTLLEAGRFGLPCIASDCGGNGEVINDGENGILVPPQDVVSLRQALSRLEGDEVLRQKMAAAALGVSSGFDLRRTAERFLEELAKIEG